MTISPISCRYHGVVALLAAMVVLGGCSSPEERANGYHASAISLIAKGQDGAARGELMRALKYRSDKVEIWRTLAGIDERGRAWQAYFQDQLRVIELDPSDIGTRLKVAQMMISGGATEAAKRVLDGAREADQGNAELHALRAITLVQAGDSSSAMREAKRALELDPKNMDASIFLANQKAQADDSDGALQILNALPFNKATVDRIQLLKTQVYLRKGDLVSAEAEVRKAMSISPNAEAYQSRLTQLLIAERKYDQAEKELRAIVAAKPGDSNSEFELVRFLNIVKGREAARAELESRIKAGGDVFDYRLAMAELDATQNKSDDVIGTFKELAASAPTPEKKISAQLKLASIYMARNETAAAEPLIKEILEKDRRNSGGLKLRALLSLEKGQVDPAISDLREALNDQPKSPDLLTALGGAYDRAGKTELAERQYADALKFSNFNPDFALRYVTFMIAHGDVAHADEVLTGIAERYPENVQILASLGKVKLSRQNWQGALTISDKLANIYQGRQSADEIRAAALAGQNKVGDSIAVLENAHRSDPEAMQPLVLLVSAYLAQGQPAKAELVLNEARQKNPQNAQLLVLFGQTKLAEKKDDDAINSFKAAIALQPQDPIAYNALLGFYVDRKDLDAAADIIKTAREKVPGDISFEISAGSVKLLKGDVDGAISDYEGILKESPNSLIAANNLASVLADYRSDPGSLARAAALSQALKASNLPQFQDTVGWVLYKQRNYKDAISVLEGAVKSAPRFSVAHYHLGMSYTAVGRRGEAADQLKIASDLEPDGTELKDSIRAALKQAEQSESAK